MASKLVQNVQKFRIPPMPTLSQLVKLYKLRAIRQLSQNFLLDKNSNSKIVKFLQTKYTNTHINLSK